MQDWPLLEEAVNSKIEEQIEFCKWWEKEITPNHGGNRQDNRSVILPKEEVEEWAMRVHRWKKYLNALQQYRARLLGAEYRAALLHDKKFYGEHEKEAGAHWIAVLVVGFLLGVIVAGLIG